MNCENCFYNQEQSSWPGHRLPCGQFNCWLELEGADSEESADSEKEDDMNIELGTIYSDPEGEWEVVAVDGDGITVKQVQDGNINFGQECLVPREEVEYFIGRSPEEW